MPRNNSAIFSSALEIQDIATILKNYMRLPFTSINIPGQVLEGVLGHVRQAKVLRTYDFIDVVDSKKEIGWQIKSTLAGTPVTWKRAKIPNGLALIAASETDTAGLQALGDAIISFCNAHARESMVRYQLREIGYARLILHQNGEATYFERVLCTRAKPDVFNARDFIWKWSKQKNVISKEQLTALHGIHQKTGKKWWAWHGRGENQLHFSGEPAWWPSPQDDHAKTFRLPSEDEKLSIEAFIDLLAASSNPLPPARSS